jgi:hypothetical protein
MVQILSKQDGPGKQEAEFKRFVKQNRGTIDQIANALTGGGLARAQKASPIVVPEASVTHGFRTSGTQRETAPYIRISPNGRVVITDYETGSQLHHLGDLRGSRQKRRFVLATKENGYFDPLSEDLQAKLLALNGIGIADEEAEDRLKGEIATQLGFDR